MLRSEALTYAVDWLRAFPALPTSAPHVQAERAEVVRLLSEPCVWRQYEDGSHATACGEIGHGRASAFCGYCGAAIREVRYQEVGDVL